MSSAFDSALPSPPAGTRDIAGVVIETEDVVAVRVAPSTPRTRGRTSPAFDMAALHPALLVLGAAAAGYIAATWARSRMRAPAAATTRQLSSTRRTPEWELRASGDSPKPHGDKFGRTLRGRDNRAPTYPEG